MTPDVDLFGAPIAHPEDLRKDGRRRKVGYAARPGSGPDGRRCSSCKHYGRIKSLDEGTITTKCQLMAHVWTSEADSDIHPNAPACREYGRRETVFKEVHA